AGDLPAGAPRPFAELVDGIKAGKYGYAIALGADLEVDAPEAQAALSKLKGLVVIASHDGPLPPAPHIVLPPCPSAEADGTYVNKKGLAQRSEAALLPRGDSRPGWELCARLARTLGYAMPWRKLTEVQKAMEPEASAPAGAPARAVEEVQP